MSVEKKLISIVVPVYNEEQNIPEVYRRVFNVVAQLPKYDFELVFFDDGSTDGSKELISSLCTKDPRVKAVLFAKNIGYSKTVFYCMQQAKGAAAILLHADLQNPPEVIPQLIEKWEQGADAVLGVKNRSRENRFMYFLRTLSYWCLNAVFGVKLIPHATEFELFDRSLISILRQMRVKNPFLRGIVLEYARNIKIVYYIQDKRVLGKSKFNLIKYYEFAMGGIVNYSKCLPRRFLIVGLVGMLLTIAETLIRFLPNINNRMSLVISNGVLLRVMVFFLFLMLALLCICMEYLISQSGEKQITPFVVEEKRINYEEKGNSYEEDWFCR